MTERLLQFIWQFQYFNRKSLLTTNNECLLVLVPGQLNHNQGPDFLEAKIKIDNTILAGSIELHLVASHWYIHSHHTDPNYNTVILHVVWQHDKDVTLANGSVLPSLELQPLVSILMLQQYEALMNSKSFSACENQLPLLSQIGWMSWKERLAVERLSARSQNVLELFQESGNHWEETFWWMLARNFGVKVNMESFESIAKSISINILAKHKSQLNQLEALLLGQAGLLNDDFEEAYPQMLQREYRFLKAKHGLEPALISPVFLRMRPANFPGLRLAQLATLVYSASHLFSKIKAADTIFELKGLLNITANDYWHYHYRFDEETTFKPKHLGDQMIENIIINTIAPVLFSYGQYHNEHRWKDKSVDWLSQLRSEDNNITKHWKEKGVSCTSALDSQALLELHKNYCNRKECLRCAVGSKMLKIADV
ncbi:DUF2851 family protein [Danxiaibacter flavus]|uniref:DUF2851 family protein n=1 Tax=Danxiaibacter flavus TaxID=3049108 RepID=A0ABV3ZCX6_9BACT|nr:DUF2851 family protein [Chitinophagaceae bacterium DXS]